MVGYYEKMHEILDKIDWFVWEPVETAHIFEDDGCHPMTEEEFNTVVSERPIFLKVPTSRYKMHHHVLEIDNILITCRQFLSTIREFYMSPITKYDIAYDDHSSYAAEARENIKKGRHVRRLDLIGSDFDLEEESLKRRSTFSCSGAVRFEGVKKIRNSLYEMVVGS